MKEGTQAVKDANARESGKTKTNALISIANLVMSRVFREEFM